MTAARYSGKKTVGAGDLKLKVAKYLFLAFAFVFFAFPLYWMIITALKPEIDWTAYPPKFIPAPATLRNFYEGLFLMKGLKGIIDSAIIALSNTALTLSLGMLAGYAFSRFRVSENLAFFILSQRFAPPAAFAVAFFILFKELGLLDSYIAIILAHTTFNLPLAVWLMKTYFDSVPKALDEAAMMDGCSPLGAFFRVILPISVPGIIATGALLFMFSWNEFLLALFLSRTAVTPFVILIPRFYGGHDILYGVVSAVAFLASLPPIIIVTLLHRYLVRGLTLGYIKGV